MRRVFFIVFISLTSFILGGGFMYLVDTTWVYDRVDRYKEKTRNERSNLMEALDVSQQLLTNSYEAFNTISSCTTKSGCDFNQTAEALTELNIKRKILRLKLDQLLDGTEASWSTKPIL